jgi:hypothetical protein
MYQGAKELDAADEEEEGDYDDDSDDNSEEESEGEVPIESEGSSEDFDDEDGKGGPTSKKKGRIATSLYTGAEGKGTAKRLTDGRDTSNWGEKPFARGNLRALQREVIAEDGAPVHKRPGSDVLMSMRSGKYDEEGIPSYSSMAKGKRRAEAELEAEVEAYPQQTRKSLRIRRRLSSEAREEEIIIPSVASIPKAKGAGKTYKEVTDAQEAILRSIEEDNASRRKSVSFSNIDRLQPAPVWNEVEMGSNKSRMFRSVLMEETRVRSESRGSRPSHVKRSRGCALQVSSSSGSRSYSSSSSSSSRSRSSWSSGRSFTSDSNISWANSTVHNEPNTAVEVEEVMAAPWYAMEEEAKQMGASAGKVVEMEAGSGSMEAALYSEHYGGEDSKEDPPDGTRREPKKSRGSTRRKGNKRRMNGSGTLAEETCKDAVVALEADAEEGVPKGG